MRLNYKQTTGILAAVWLVMAFFTLGSAGASPPCEGMPPSNRDGRMPHEGKMPPMPHHRFWTDSKLVESLKLTEGQLGQLKELDFSFREKQVKLKSELAELDLQLEKAFASEPLNESTVLEAAQKLSDLKGKMFLQRIENRLAVEGILTPDQQKMLKTFPPSCPRMDEMDHRP